MLGSSPPSRSPNADVLEGMQMFKLYRRGEHLSLLSVLDLDLNVLCKEKRKPRSICAPRDLGDPTDRAFEHVSCTSELLLVAPVL
jgi:hypothetical protein